MNTLILDNSSKLTLNNNKYIQLDAGITAEILVIGGGGSGGAGSHEIAPNNIYTGGGGGGAGQYIYHSSYNLPSYFNVVIGEGGVWDSTPNGGNTIVNDIIAYGGGAGGIPTVTSSQYAYDGASGGGSHGQDDTEYFAGSAIYGSGGYDGGKATTVNGGGGGGAGGAGGANRTAGLYITNSISSNPVNYCTGGVGGLPTTNPSTVPANLGNGGHGCGSDYTPSSGGSGVFILKYLGTPIATGGTINQSGGYTVHKFTSNGVFSKI